MFRSVFSAAIVTAVAVGQVPVAPPSLPPGLSILVLEGQGAVNDVRTRVGIAPVIEVRDANDRPVEGADVTFELPPSGPGGLFPGQQLVRKTRTNYQGQAIATFVPNTETGPFRIRVTAMYRAHVANASITQTNALGPAMLSAPRKSGRWWKIVVVAGAAAGGVAAGVAAARNGSQRSAPPPIPTVTLIPGAPAFGGPR